ncbi:MAG: hypothetical protein ABSG83_00750 [Roseiarcus sp.]
MNRAAAWSVRGVGRDTRDAAQQAARRAGMSLGEWLDEVIADQAAEQGVNPEDFDEDERLDAIGDRLSGLSRRGEPFEGRWRRERDPPRARPRDRGAAADDLPRAEQLLDEAIRRFEGRAARTEARTARALDSVASLFERSQGGRREERAALHEVVGRLESLEDRIARQQAEREASSKRSGSRDLHAARAIEARTPRAPDPVADPLERAEAGGRRERQSLQDVVGRLEGLEERITRQQADRREPESRPDGRGPPRTDEGADSIGARIDELSRRVGASDRSRAASRHRPRIDIDSAVSQIAQRRRELDAGAPGARGARNFQIDAPTERKVEAAPTAREGPGASAVQDGAASALQVEIRKLGQRLDDMRREQSERRETPAAGVEALRDDLAAMSRSLADLAPRNAVLALEGAIRDLSQRVVASRESGARETLLRPVEELVDALRDSLRAHDPREAVQGLRREIGAIGAKLDGLAETTVDPRIFEPILRQIEETRSLLSALAQRPMPLERLERQIGELADRVENLAASPAPQVESARLLASLDEARAQVERSASASALNSIESRLEEVASRIDQALQRPLAASVINPRALEDLSLRIDGVRQAIEAHHASPSGAPSDTNLLEQAMREISAKLDRPVTAAIDANAFEGLFHDLGERIDRRAAPVVDTAPLERALRRLEDRPSGPDTAHLEQLMHEISAKLDRPVSAAIDAHAFEDLFHDLGSRIDNRPSAVDPRPGESETAQLEQLMREISAKLDRPVTAAIDASALEDLFRDLAARIDKRPAAVDTAPFEQALRKLGDRSSPVAMGPLEDLMREISAKLDRASQPAVDASAIETMIQEIGARIDRRPEVVVDTRYFEQTLAAIHDKIEQSALPQSAVEGIEHALESLAGQIAARAGGREGGPLEAMLAELLAHVEDIRQALRDAPAPPPARAATDDDLFARDLAALRAEQTNADRRLQSTLGGVHDVLETLVDRIGRIEDDVARAGPPPQERTGADPSAGHDRDEGAGSAAAAFNAMDVTIRDAPPPGRTTREQRSEGAPLTSLSQAAATPMRSIDGSQFLIEPGAGAPLRASASDAIAGANPQTAFIAAARRAAQAALAEEAKSILKDSAKPARDASAGPGGLGKARAFLATRRRPILLGVALVALLAVVVVELGVWRLPNMQKSDNPTVAAPKLAAAESAADPAARPAPAKTEVRALDITPTGSVTAPTASGPTTRFLSPAPADMVAAIPAAAPRGLRDAAAAGDPAAQFELASRLAEGRGLPRDPRAAFSWFERAAGQGLAPAEYRLGSLYDKGIGVTRDPVAARTWYGKAADAGNARAMHNLAVLIAEGGGAKPDYSQAAGWFHKAAQLGVKDSQFNLAILYARGMGMAQDLGQAWVWFSLAAQQGDADAAKKRDEVAAKLDAKAIAAATAALATFHASQPAASANEVPSPPGGWDALRSPAPQSTSQPAGAPAAPI